MAKRDSPGWAWPEQASLWKAEGSLWLLSTEEEGRERHSGSLEESRHPCCDLIICGATAHRTAGRKRDLNPTVTRVVTRKLGGKTPKLQMKTAALATP